MSSIEKYDELLKKVYVKLPKEAVEKTRFEFPKMESFIQGSKTIVKNYGPLKKAINRDSPKDLLKFLTKETGTSVEEAGERLIINGKFGERQIQEWIQRYLNDFILCKQCHKPDTRELSQNGTRVLKCDACGASFPISKN